jgi:hypothetical protein
MRNKGGKFMTIYKIKKIKSSLDEINFKMILHEKEYKENGSHKYMRNMPV